MEEPLPIDETLKGLNSYYKEKYGKELSETWMASVHRMLALAENSHQGPAKKLESFCKAKANEKLITMFGYDVPPFILPEGYTATLYDFKVKARGPDDEIYKNHPDIRKMVARGTTTMQLNGPESWYDVVVYANKKFTGGIGDEDDTQIHNDDIWREYCLEPPENAEQIVCMEKLNGDAAHLAGRYINGKFFLFTGSKNTHMLIREKQHIDLYVGDRYVVAKRFGRTVCDTLERLNPKVQHLLCSFLHHTKTTAIFEVLQPEYQHLVDLSYLKENELNLIAFTPTASDGEETTLTAFPPKDALDLGRALGLACAPYTLIKPDTMMEHREQIRSDIYKEGEVLYYVNKQGDTFGIAKAKSIWYIFLRALREKTVYIFVCNKKKPDWTLNDGIKSTFKRFDDIQKWLKLSDHCLQGWKNIGEAYIKWMDEEVRQKRVMPNNIRPQYPVIWKRFLAATKLDDKIPM